MKYRDPKTGEVFEDIFDARDRFCEGKDCDTCAMPNVCRRNLPTDSCNCAEFTEKHPAEAARLMGLEIITDKEESMEKKDGPRICEVLGGKDSPLKVGEVFTIRDYPNRGDRYAVIHTDGKVHNYLAEPCQTTGTRIGDKIGSNALYWLIEHPDRILRKPHFTQEEVAVLWYMSSVGVVSIEKKAETHLYWDGVDRGGVMVVPASFFPSLRPGQAVALSDITGGNT